MKRMLLVVILVFAVVPFALGQAKAPGRGKGSASSKIEDQIKSLENRWNDAMLKHDPATLDHILAEDVVDTSSSNGQASGKADDLADLKAGEPKLDSSSIDDMKVRVYGNVALVNGHFTQKGTYKGKDLCGEGRFTDVFVKRQGRWECVSTQGTCVH